MKKLALSTIMLCLMTGQAMAIATVTSTTYVPNPSNLQNLDHNYYYSWDIDTNITDPTRIIGAQLRIDNINDWQVESNDHLYVHMVDEAKVLGTRISSDVTRGTDNEGGGDKFAGQGSLLLNYSDTNEYTEWVGSGWRRHLVTTNPAEDLIYDLTMADLGLLRTFLANGSFGLMFDPDCHYNNCGISFTIYTQPPDQPTPPDPVVPEPVTSALMLLGVGGFAGLRRLRKR